MAWRPTDILIEGELDNTKAGKVTGWMIFAGIKGKVTFDLQGNFHRDIRGTLIHFNGPAKSQQLRSDIYMKGFARHQTGKVGDMTAGLPPADYVKYPYFEWYGNDNGRVVIELEQSQVQVIGTPIPPDQCEPVSRIEQARNMNEFLIEIVTSFSKQEEAG